MTRHPHNNASSSSVVTVDEICSEPRSEVNAFTSEDGIGVLRSSFFLTPSAAMSKLLSTVSFFPTEMERVTSPEAVSFGKRYRRSAVYVPSLRREVLTAHIQPNKRFGERVPACLLHGFDSSSFDFRRLVPYVEGRCETWAVDLVGWGFSDHELFVEDPALPLGPEVKREHLYQFWKMFIRRPMCLMGVSLGGAVAVDYALHYPETVDSLVLSSAQGYIDGLGLLSKAPSFIARLGVQLLRTEVLRRIANGMAFHDKSIDVEEAMIISRLHTLQPGWMEASLAFIKSDGYSISKDISGIDVPTLILWGREDQVLGTESAERFHNDILNSKLCWIDGCGHAGHLERHNEIGDHLLDFLDERQS